MLKYVIIMRYVYILLLAAVLSCANMSCDRLSGITSERSVVGGYSEPRKLSDEERALFDSVAAEIAGVKYEPINVATQIVADTNYRFLCKGKETERRGKKFYAVIVVHKPLPNAGEPRVMSIERQKR